MDNTKILKKQYQPPMLTRVRLVTEEAMAGGCKTSTGRANGNICQRTATGCTARTRGS